MFDKTKIKYFIGIVAITGLLIFVLKPKDKSGIKTPSLADKKKIDEKENARIALDAYLNAVEAGENQQALLKLNAIMSEQFGIRVARKKDGTWVARSSDGRDILYVRA